MKYEVTILGRGGQCKYEKTRQREEIICEFSVEQWNDLANGLESTSEQRDDVVDATSTMPVFVQQSVNSLPSGGGGVDSSHQTFDDTDIVVNDVGKGGEAVGCAGRIRDL